MIPSAIDLWFQNYGRVHKASQLSTNDVKFKFFDFTAELLQLISIKLPHSTGFLPRDWNIVRGILEKAERRLLYLKDPQQYSTVYPREPADPVKIVVLGGSILVGRNCRKLLRDMGKNLNMRLPNKECTHSFRLQVFLDQMTSLLLHPDKPLLVGEPLRRELGNLFLVSKIAMGGTNTAVGNQIFKYDLIPEEAQGADIVLNAYATNDMHVLTMQDFQAEQKTLREGVFDMIQDFVRTIMQPNSCQDKNHPEFQVDRRPLLLHLDDYVGNEQREILQTMELSQSVGTLAQYYGFATISYANIVREWVYGDTHESWFSPEGWWAIQPDMRRAATKTTTMQREIHPGMGFHIATSWIVAYNLLHIATTYCSMEQYLDSGGNDLVDYEKSWASNLIPLTKELAQAPGRPHSVPSGLPPRLNSTLLLDDISERWLNQTDGSVCRDTRRCPFSWVSGLSLQQNDKTWILDYFAARTMKVPNQKPWELVDEGGKIGFMAQGVGNRWALEFLNLPRPIQTVSIFYLRSYGDKWQDSRASISLSAKTNGEQWMPLGESLELLGSHSKNTSEMYSKELDFLPVLAGGALRIVFELRSGSTFKLMGLAVCQ